MYVIITINVNVLNTTFHPSNLSQPTWLSVGNLAVQQLTCHLGPTF